MSELNENKAGELVISDGVIAGIAAEEINDIAGVAGLCDSVKNGLFGIKTPGKAVRAEIKDCMVSIDIDIIVEYGIKIQEVSWEIQDKLLNAVESMTGLKVSKINVYVKGIKMPSEEKSE